MRLLVGPGNVPVGMCNTEYCHVESLTAHCEAMLRDGARLSLDAGYGSVVPVYNEHELALAARLVAEYHNAALNRFDDDGWIRDTASIWEEALFTIDDTDGVPLAVDEATDPEPRRLPYTRELEALVQPEPLPTARREGGPTPC